jgi:ubiquinone/menaquinone biosynthesis C-methylase UbiE
VPSSSLIALAAAVLHVPSKPERVLEIGCGDGEAVLFLAREYPSARVRGVDASAETVREAVARIGLDPEGRVAFKQGRSRALPYPDVFFDLIVQSGGSPHPREIARVLRPGGHLILVGTWRLLDWRLGGHGLESVAADEIDGWRYNVFRFVPSAVEELD